MNIDLFKLSNLVVLLKETNHDKHIGIWRNSLFRKKTVEHFIKQGYEVTIATRGHLQDHFGNQVKRIIVDRRDGNHSGWQIIRATDWDIVFDNICYTESEARIALEHLATVDHYLVTSSLAVYQGEPGPNGFTEAQFNPVDYSVDKQKEVDYGEGKRQVETFFTNHASFPVTFLRFPVVLDDDDYTERLHFYIRRALKGEDIIFKRDSGHFSFVRAAEIPLAIQFVIDNKVVGPINISSTNSFTTAQFIESLASSTQKELTIVFGPRKELSPFSHYDLAMDASYLAHLGYPVPPLASWLPDLMDRLVVTIKNE